MQSPQKHEIITITARPSLARVINMQPHHGKYHITQFEELGFS